MEFPLYFTSPPSAVASSDSQTTSHGGNRKVVAWIHSITDMEYLYIIWPLYATLGEALQGQGAQVQVSFRRHTALVERDVHASLEAGALPILIVLFWNAYELSHPGAYQDSLLRLQRLAVAGAYMILYNTEPRAGVLIRAKSFAAKMNAKEVWDYSLSNLAHYKAKVPGVLTRHVYPGCAHGTDFGVVQDNATENYDVMGFIGAFERRPPAVRELYLKSGLLRPSQQKVKDGNSWKAYLEEFPVQLNLHQPWNTYGAFEVFRAAQLLANRACVFSENSNELEMAFWKEMVHFGQNAALLDDFRAMRGNKTAIEACRMQGHEVFCNRMRPHQIFESSGFSAKLRELQESFGTT